MCPVEGGILQGDMQSPKGNFAQLDLNQFTHRSSDPSSNPWPKIEEIQTVINRVNSRVNYLQKVSEMLQTNIHEVSKVVKNSLPPNENIALMDSNHPLESPKHTRLKKKQAFRSITGDNGVIQMDTESQDLDSFRIGNRGGPQISVKDIKTSLDQQHMGDRNQNHQRTSSEEIVDTQRFMKKTPNQGIKANSSMVNPEFKDFKIFRIEQIINWDSKIQTYQGPIQSKYRQAIGKLTQIKALFNQFEGQNGWKIKK